jgi:hypothetical protein
MLLGLLHREKQTHVRCQIGTTVIADFWTSSPVSAQRRPDEWYSEEARLNCKKGDKPPDVRTAVPPSALCY